MSILNDGVSNCAGYSGVVIADPAKSNLNYRKNVDDLYTVTRKLPGEPLGQFSSEQTVLRRFDREMPSNVSPTLESTKVATVPVTKTLNNEMVNLQDVRRINLWANVEKAQLQAANTLRDVNIESTVWYDPKSVNPVEFKETVRPKLRPNNNPASLLANSNGLAAQDDYVHNANNRSIQKRYYDNNSWKDSKGRIHLFEQRFTRNFA